MTATATALKPYYVCSPEYGTVEPILDDGTGPIEYGRETVEVMAANKHEARIWGLRLLRASTSRDAWIKRYEPSENPFTGMIVEEAICQHGNPHFELDENGKPNYLDCHECVIDAEESEA